jgi:hypothetical protein
MKIMTAPVVPIMSVHLQMPTLMTQLCGSDEATAMYTTCSMCAGRDHLCALCKHIRDWAPGYTQRIAHDHDVLVGHMLDSITAADKLVAATTGAPSRRLLRAFPTEVLQVMASATNLPLATRQAADREFDSSPSRDRANSSREQ